MIVIYLFLQSVQATIAPAVAIPISLIGTLAAIWLAGFSVNILTLLALVVATGLVVDDSNVVIENIARHRAMGIGSRAAAVLGTRQIIFAVLSTTATLAAVFIPISFLPGIVGRLFSEFGFVLAFAVTISSAVALVLCPMLAARLGTGSHNGRKTRLGRWGEAASSWCRRALDFCLTRSKIVWLVCAVFICFGWLAYDNLAKEITPAEDRGIVLVRLSTQQGSNLEYMSAKVEKVEKILGELKKRGEVTDVLALVGRGSANRAFVIAPLAPWSERRRSQQDIQRALQRQLATIPGLSVRLLSPNSLGIRGGGQGLRFAIAGPITSASPTLRRSLASA